MEGTKINLRRLKAKHPQIPPRLTLFAKNFLKFQTRKIKPVGRKKQIPRCYHLHILSYINALRCCKTNWIVFFISRVEKKRGHFSFVIRVSKVITSHIFQKKWGPNKENNERGKQQVGILALLANKDETNVLINRMTFQFHNIVRPIEAAFSKGNSKQFRGILLSREPCD